MDYTQIATYGFPVLAGLIAAVLYFKVDTKIEDAKRLAIKVSADMKKFGLKKIPVLFDDFVVGDKSGLLNAGVKLVQDLTADDGAIMRELQDVFKNVLAEQVKTDEGKAYVQSVLDAASVGPAPAPVADTSVATK